MFHTDGVHTDGAHTVGAHTDGVSLLSQTDETEVYEALKGAVTL